MQDSIYTTINTSSVDRIENLSNDIVSSANQIHAIVQPQSYESSLGEQFAYWLKNYSFSENIINITKMDDWNLCVTLFIYALALYVWVMGIPYLVYRIIKRKENKSPFQQRKQKSENSFILLLLKAILFIPKHIFLLPWDVVDYGFTLWDYFWKNPIKRDRALFSTDGFPLLTLSFKIAILTPLTLLLLIFVPISIITQILDGGDYSSALWIFDTASQDKTNILWAMLSQYMDPGNLSNSDKIGSFIAFIMASSGVVCLSGLLVSAIVNVISQRRDRWQKGLVLYKNTKVFYDYVVIIGINEQTASLVRQALHRDPVNYVLIQTRKNVEKARMDLELKMDDELEDRIVFYAGERTSAEDLSKLQLEKAIEVYILGESVNDPNEKDHDAYNISCLEHISKYISEHKSDRKTTRKLRVHVDLEYQSTFTAFKATHLYQKLDRDIEFVPFNVHDIWAKKILIDNFAIYPSGNKAELKVQRYNPIDRYIKNREIKCGITENCIDDEQKTVHLVIFGMNQMGTALATQAALLCHFPNFAKDNKCRTTITFIDDHAIEEADYFMGRFSTLFELSRYRIINCKKEDFNKPFVDPFEFEIDQSNKIQLKDTTYKHLVNCENNDEPAKFGGLLDVEWEFIQGNVASAMVKDYVEGIAKDPLKTVTVAICFNNSQQALASAMYLPKTIFDNCNQVLVYQQSIFDLVNDVSKGDAIWARYRNLFPFGMIESSYTENPYDNFLAKLDYYIYKKQDNLHRIIECIDQNKNYDDLLDDVDKLWEQVGIVRKNASIDSVANISLRLRSMSAFNKKDIYAIAKDEAKISEAVVEAEHLRWMMQRLISGYRHYTNKEQESFMNIVTNNKQDEEEIVQLKKERYIEQLKNTERAHVDICSFERMKEYVHPSMAKEDKNVIVNTPYLIKGSELLSILRLSNSRYEDSQHFRCLKKFFRNDTHYNSFLFIDGSKVDKETKNKKGVMEFDSKNYCKHSFWMNSQTVTKEQWYDVMGKDKSELNDSEKILPMTNVSKNEIDDFIDILRKRSGLRFELPSLKEWNVAATYYADSKMVINPQPLHPSKIGSIICDATKLYHILGNVWEWTHTSDGHEGFYFCGGSHLFGANECDISNVDKKPYYKQTWASHSKSSDLGFRLIWGYDQNINIGHINSKPRKNGLQEQNPNMEQIVNWFKKYSMVNVPAGLFVMGTDDKIDPEADKNEMPRHTVKISEDFYMCSVPVTQSLWNAVHGYDQLRKNPTKNRYGDDIPQTDVTWDDVEDFIRKLNDLFTDKKINLFLKESGIPWIDKYSPNDFVFRLPTEAEWEYAAKGEKNEELQKVQFKKFNHVYNEDKTKILKWDEYGELFNNVRNGVTYNKYASVNDKKSDDVAWFAQPAIQEVRKKDANLLGLYDMSGNVWEWCYDFYIFDMYDACRFGNNKEIQEKYVEGQYNKLGYIEDPVALAKSYSAHVFRGGSWRSTEWDCRCTRANFWIASYKSNDLGFRLVLGKPINK